jgi:two-component system OmpR family response regulator
MTDPLRLLCVDDDPDIRTVTVMALGLDRDIEARGVASGAEALATLAEEGWRPHAILLDVMMQEMSGPALMTAIQDSETIADVPIIFMTARASSSAIAEYRALGAIGVIVKPFDPIHLAGEVRGLLGEQDRPIAARG